jgi:hypothetical protein
MGLKEKAPPKRGQVLVSLLHSLAGGRPAVSMMPGESKVFRVLNPPGASFGRTPEWRPRA